MNVRGVRWPEVCVGCGVQYKPLVKYKHTWKEKSLPKINPDNSWTTRTSKLRVTAYLCESCTILSKTILERDVKPIRNEYIQKLCIKGFFAVILPVLLAVILLELTSGNRYIGIEVYLIPIAFVWSIIGASLMWGEVTDNRPAQVDMMNQPWSPFISINSSLRFSFPEGPSPSIRDLEFVLSDSLYYHHFITANPGLKTSVRMKNQPHKRDRERFQKGTRGDGFVFY